MFCPLSADWGNVADWAGAIGSLAAVIVALYIAFHESWSLKRERQYAEDQKYLIMAQLRAEVIRLAGEIEAIVDEAYVAGRPQDDIVNWQQTLQEKVDGCRQQLTALQTLAVSDPQLFGLIGRMVAETKFEFDLRTRGAEIPSRLIQIAKAMAERRETIVALG